MRRLLRTSSKTSSRPPKASSPTRRTGSTAAGPASRRPRKARAAATPRVSIDRLKSVGLKLTEVPERLHRPQDHRAVLSNRRKMIEDGARHRLVHGRGARLRHAARRRLPRAPLRPGRGARHLLAAPRRADDQVTEEQLHPAQPHLARARRASRSSTRCCPKRRCWASNTAIASPSRTRSCSGKRNSATSPTAPRWSSTSSSSAASANGCACRA